MGELMNREAWLNAALGELLVLLESRVPPGLFEEGAPKVRASVGWPSLGRRDVIGECWPADASAGQVHEIFVSPTVSDPVDVLCVLLHELIHAYDRNRSKHAGRFRVAHAMIGFDKPFTGSVASEELRADLESIQRRLPEYPHYALTKGRRPKQATRMLKVECSVTGYLVRLTRKWLDEFGEPYCPCCRTPMELAWD